jgi:hypothetical protein
MGAERNEVHVDMFALVCLLVFSVAFNLYFFELLKLLTSKWSIKFGGMQGLKSNFLGKYRTNLVN